MLQNKCAGFLKLTPSTSGQSPLILYKGINKRIRFEKGQRLWVAVFSSGQAGSWVRKEKKRKKMSAQEGDKSSEEVELLKTH